MGDYLVARLHQKQALAVPIVSITAYDYFTAILAREADVDFVLVGDSLGNVVQGAASTVPVTLEQMIYHTRIVCAHFPPERTVLDMPFGSFKLSTSATVKNCVRAFKESGCGGVKLEGAGASNLEAVQILSEAGIPVIGHLGLQPQRVHADGGYRMQGKTPAQAARISTDARAMQAAGAIALVLECVVPELAAAVTQELGIPTIGIGCGPNTDGQIIVVHDILGMLPGGAPSFAKRYADLHALAMRAVGDYAREVREGSFPSAPRAAAGRDGTAADSPSAVYGGK
jgi:3-methyl-2-oxobutanoate hydroxymethyltransferase